MVAVAGEHAPLPLTTLVKVAASSMLLHPMAHASAQVACLDQKFKAKQIFQVILRPSQSLQGEFAHP